ncbi:DJ-1/PfpI family protein [Halohasta litorea]|uniref:DJ-1/PfpI family protein n=1 Tax=Halohasta litorea TaxID=869891 RepID=A0ABD6DA45_9EURY|nr:DJ-1/PfpI family protein [Halohasta litorea]
MHIAIVVFEGVDELDAIAPFEVFENARQAGADLSVTLCTLDAPGEITASHGLRIGIDDRLDDLDPDLLVVPGGQWGARGETGAWAEAERGDLPAAIACLQEAGVDLAAVCTGGMLLARAGVTDGRPATTHASARDELEASGAELADGRVVDDGDLVTAGGVTAGLDLAFHLVAREFGDEVAQRVATQMEYEPAEAVVP